MACGKDGGLAGARDAVQRFVPPIVGGDVEARDRGRRVLHLEHFFVEGHARDQVGGALFGGEIGIEVVLAEQGGAEGKRN